MRLIDFYALSSIAVVSIGILILFKEAVHKFELGKGKSTFETYEDLFELFFPKEGTVLGSICGAATFSMLVVRFISPSYLLYAGVLVSMILILTLIKFQMLEMKYKNFLSQ